MAGWLGEANVICEFGWLIEKLRRTSWTAPPDIALLEEMVRDLTTKRMDILEREYAKRQEEVAWKLLSEKYAAGDQVVVCLHSIHKMSRSCTCSFVNSRAPPCQDL